MLAKSILPEVRRAKLKSLIQGAHRAVRAMEVHNGLSALVANDASIHAQDGSRKSFDALWVSGLTESASRGLPDIELQGMLSRVAVIREIIGVTDKPIIVDGDTGGTEEQLEYFIRTLEGYGVSALVIEDKVFPKNNSLDFNKSQTLADPEVFSRKIAAGKKAQLSPDFMLVARTEALVAGAEMENALMRARKYTEAGADAIVIHSRASTPDEVLEFSRRFRELGKAHGFSTPLVAIPTMYNSITEDALYDSGFKLVIHANFLLRSAYQAMLATAQTILTNGRSLEVEPNCVSLKALFNVIEGAKNASQRS